MSDGNAYGALRTKIDLPALNKYLASAIDSLSAPVEIQQFAFGQSNPTFLLKDANGQSFVLRKKPDGELLSKTAHAVEREYQILKAMQGTKVPVPKVYCLCTDLSVLGTPFYVMEYLQGRIFTDINLPEIESHEERRKMWFSIIKTLADLHSINPDDVGLGNYASKKAFYPRQIRSLSRVSAAQATVFDPKKNAPIGNLPMFEELNAWYAKNCPHDDGYEGGIVHGDFKCDNLMFHATEPRVIGVLDWELSTLGHPLSDLSNLLQPFYIRPTTEGSADAPELTPLMTSGLRGIPAYRLRIPTADELIRSYCSHTNRPYPVEKWDACVSFAFFRLAIIMQGIAARSAKGQASSARAHLYSNGFVIMGQMALDEVLRVDPNFSGGSKI